MLQTGDKPVALAAVEKRVLVENLSQTVTRRLRHQVDAKIVRHTHPVRIPSLAPLRHRIVRLLHSPRDRRADEGIRAERIEGIVAQFFLFRRAFIDLPRLYSGSVWRHDTGLAGGLLRRWSRLLLP